ncbi:MAG: DNRLRE domain-containing protein [Hamadaea sp.]|nr:DNRLRE domain-containing protein [Hamadaea sp.]
MGHGVGRRRRFLAATLTITLLLGMTTVLPERPGGSSTDGDGGGRTSLIDALRDVLGVGDDSPDTPVTRALDVKGVPRNNPAPAAVTWQPAKRTKEVIEERTTASSTWQLSDGRMQTEISATPVNYVDSNGDLRPIDTTVRDSGRVGWVKANTTNGFTTLFGASSHRLVRFEAGDRWVELGLEGPARTITPKVTGSTVTYPGVAGGADLVYEVTSTTLKDNIVLAAAPGGALTYGFVLKTHGLEPQRRADGSIGLVVPGAAEPLWSMPAPFMFDAAGERSYAVEQQLERRGETSLVTVTTDGQWLRESGRRYPVTLDPTIRIQPVPTDGQDVQIYSGDANRNYNDTYQLRVGTDATNTWRSLVRFPLTGVPAGTVIDDAKLQMFYSQSQHSSNFDVAVEARQVTQPWSESTATWATTNSAIAAVPAGNVVVVDDTDTGKIVMNGSWPASGNTALTQHGVNASYRYNNDATAGNTFTWVPTLTEDGDYQVEVHYVAAGDRPTNAQYTVQYAGGQQTYTVDQTGPEAGVWKTLGVHRFTAGTTGRVVLGDVAGKAVIADAVRFTKSGVATRKANVSSVWHTFSVRNIVQSWITAPTTNHGFMLKAVDETPKGLGGPSYEAAEYSYDNAGRDYNLPKLILTWGRPGAALVPPTTISATGALLNWSAYADPSGATGDDIVEYQVHRSVYQTFTPSAATLIAPVKPGTLTYQDTSAKPTPANTPDDQLGQLYYYMIAVKTADGQVVAAPTEGVRLPKAGQVTRIIRTDVTDTNLSQTLPDTNVDLFAGDTYSSAGNNSTVYGDTRSIVRFGTLDGIPAGANVVNAQLRMWTAYNHGATDGTVDVHKLTRGWNETAATWNKSDASSPWTTPGGDFDPVALSSFNGFTNDPEWEHWDVTGAVKTWLATPQNNHGLLLKMRDESVSTQRAIMHSSETSEALLRPTLAVTYLESTYYAPGTPEQMRPATTYTAPVSLANTTATAWDADEWELSYRWSLPDGTEVTNAANQVATALPGDVAAGATVDLTAQVKTPATAAEANKRTDYVLRWDLRNKTSGQWLSATGGVAPLEQRAAVEEPTSDQLGLEGFYAYDGGPTGAGSSLMNNLYSGNTVWTYDAFSNPSRGLATFAKLTYNSLDTSNTVAGFGWSVQASSLSRLGMPLFLHPKPNPTTAILTDGDGTSHTFTWNAGAGQWDSPKGVHLYLQRHVVCDAKTEESRAWSMTRPDRTQIFYDCDGYLSSVEDNSGNLMTFTYEVRRSQNKPTKFLRYITDAVGRQTLTVDYWAKGDTYDYVNDTTWAKVSGVANLTNPHIIDRIRTITDVSGRKLAFTYTDKGLLGQLVDGAGATQPKVFGFQYDMTQGVKNVKLVKVVDPRGNATSLAYYGNPEDDPKFRWTTKSYTDRMAQPKSFGYTDPDGQAGSVIHTAVTDQELHTTQYQLDGYGRPTQITDAKSQVTKLGWDTGHHLVRVEDPAGGVTTSVIDQKTGYPTEMKTAEANAKGWPATTYAYQTGMDGRWADLIAVQSPEGRRWTYAYDLEGHLEKATDPAGFDTTYSSDTWGQVLSVTDANGNVTTFSDHDPSGFPKKLTDALQNITSTVYDVRGNITSITDARGKTSTFAVDVFGRSGRSTTPFVAGSPIVVEAPVYDANDNVLRAYAANSAERTFTWDALDRVTASTTPADVAGGTAPRTVYGYDKVGNLVRQEDPKGFVRTFTYDAVYQMTSGRNAAGGVVAMTYDAAGNVVTYADPRKTVTADPDDFTTKFAYDRDGKPTKETDAAGFWAAVEYDKDGLAVVTIDKEGVRTSFGHDPRGLVTSVTVPRDIGVSLTTKYEYDKVGNLVKTVSPRGVATTDDPDDFASVAVYDKLNRVAEEILPYDRDDNLYHDQDKILRTYDAVGNLLKVSAPPSDDQTIRNDTVYSYYDSGWLRTSTDPWQMVDSFEYNVLGQQTKRVHTGSDGATSREQTWTYFPDGKLKSQRDEGLPTGAAAFVVDNTDVSWVKPFGPQPWTASSTGTGYQGHNYYTHAPGSGGNTFQWVSPKINELGEYEIWVRYPAVQGAATNATFSVKVGQQVTNVTVDQTQRAGEWVSLGKYLLQAENQTYTAWVTLSDNANGVVVADGIRFLRTPDAVDMQHKAMSYAYDLNGNLTSILDQSTEAVADEYVFGYDDLNRNVTRQEKKAGTVLHNTTQSFDENSNLTYRKHDAFIFDAEYDTRDLLTKVTNTTLHGEIGTKVTSYGYDPNGLRNRVTRSNGNVVDYETYLDGRIKHQIERTAAGATVAEHTLGYDDNGNRTSDTVKLRRPDDQNAYLNRTQTYTYDPRDRVAEAVKTDTANGAQYKESFIHDANNNVVQQSWVKPVEGGTEILSTQHTYDRNRLLQSWTQLEEVPTSYHHDAFGRLTSMDSGDGGSWFRYDAFDRKQWSYEYRREYCETCTTSSTETTYQYDSLDRVATRLTSHTGSDGASGFPVENKFTYLGMSDALMYETGAHGQPGQGNAYHYGPTGEMLLQDQKFWSANSYWSHSLDPHGSVEAITGASGATGATYGYTAYGSDDESMTIGDGLTGGWYSSEPLNTYRYNGQKLDWTSGTYDMGSRDYFPSINRFLTADSSASGVGGQSLAAGASTANLYGFAGANPINFVDPSGHNPVSDFFGDFFGYIGSWFKDWAKGTFDLSYMCMAEGSEYCIRAIGSGLQPYIEDPIAATWHEISDPVKKEWNEDRPGGAAAAAIFAIFSLKNLKPGKVENLIFLGRIPSPGAVVANKSGRVGYDMDAGHTDLSLRAAHIRRKLKFGQYRNIAIFEITVGTERFAFAGISGRGTGKHSEENLGPALEDLLARLQKHGLGTENVSRIYSELSPCGKGYRDCNLYVRTTFWKAKITYSWPHPVGVSDWKARVATYGK